MRASGLSPERAGGMLARIGLAFVVITFVTGEWISPFSEQLAQQVRMRLGDRGGWRALATPSLRALARVVRDARHVVRELLHARRAELDGRRGER